MQRVRRREGGREESVNPEERDLNRGRSRARIGRHPPPTSGRAICVPTRSRDVGGDGRARPKAMPSAYATLPATVRDRPARRLDVCVYCSGSAKLRMFRRQV